MDGLLSVADPKDNRIHTHFSADGHGDRPPVRPTRTLQNIPVRTELGRELRRMFVAPDKDHILIDADYSQIELRVLAHISGDRHMIGAFRTRTGHSCRDRVKGIPSADRGDHERDALVLQGGQLRHRLRHFRISRSRRTSA